MTVLQVIDWGDEAYSTHGKSRVVAEVEIVGPFTGFSYDGGRLDIDGHPETIYLWTSQFSVRTKENNDE